MTETKWLNVNVVMALVVILVRSVQDIRLLGWRTIVIAMMAMVEDIELDS